MEIPLENKRKKRVRFQLIYQTQILGLTVLYL